MDLKITMKDAKEVADAIRSRFDTDIVRGLNMRLSSDHYGDDCIRIVVQLDKNYKEKDFLNGVVGLNGHVIDVLRDDLKHLFPYIRFKEV